MRRGLVTVPPENIEDALALLKSASPDDHSAAAHLLSQQMHCARTYEIISLLLQGLQADLPAKEGQELHRVVYYINLALYNAQDQILKNNHPNQKRHQTTDPQESPSQIEQMRVTLHS